MFYISKNTKSLAYWKIQYIASACSPSAGNAWLKYKYRWCVAPLHSRLEIPIPSTILSCSIKLNWLVGYDSKVCLHAFTQLVFASWSQIIP